MKIANFHLNRLRNDAHFMFHTEFRDLIAKESSAKLKIKPLFNEYQPLYDRVDEALKKIVKSEFTAKIQDADKARDEIWLGMTEMNIAALKHFSPQVRESAARLKIVFDAYGYVAKKSLNEETAAIYNLLQELQGKYSGDAAAIGIAEWVAELQARNNAFEALVKERFEETAARTHVVLKDARKAADEAYKKICVIIEANVIQEGMDNYETFINTLNAVIAKYAAKRQHHHHRPDAPASGQPEGTQNDV